jgi:tetratricopeptide (TPR) repeat protein
MILFTHLVPDPSLVSTRTAREDRLLGTIAPLPDRISGRHHDAVERSRALYRTGNYAGAVAALRAAVEDEPDNPLLINEYARALYWIEERKGEAGDYYLALIQYLDAQPVALLLGQPNTILIEPSSGRLDSGTIYPQTAEVELPLEVLIPGEQSKNITLIDYWFIEAYWKLGTLYLDIGAWKKAIFEISRVLFAIGTRTQPELAEQAFGFLTEAYCEMGHKKWARYYGEITLRMNPGNTYVLPYLDRVGRY